jgi:hypothetical protein
MKKISLIVLLSALLGLVFNANSQTPARLKGKKMSVHCIDGKYGPFQGNLGYSYTLGLEGKCDLELAPGEHTIEFAYWTGDKAEYKLVFTAESDKTYEFIRNKDDADKPQLIESKTKQPIEDALMICITHFQSDETDKTVRMYEGNVEKSKLAVLTLAPEFYDIIPLVYKIDGIWGPVLAVMWRYNNYKKGNDFRGATKAMSFTIELLPGEHTLEYSLHSNKVNLTWKDGLTTGADSYDIYSLIYNFEAGKTYSFKFLDPTDPESIAVVEKTE